MRGTSRAENGSEEMPTKKSRGPRRRRLDPDAAKKREAAIINDLKAGTLSYRMIAQKHGVSLPTVNAKARKAGISRPRGRRPLSAKKAMERTVSMRTAVAAAKPARPAAARRGRPSNAAAARGFHEAFRAMVLRYFPGITLAQFDRLARIVEENVR